MTLTVNGPGGIDTLTQVGYINVYPMYTVEVNTLIENEDIEGLDSFLGKAAERRRSGALVNYGDGWRKPRRDDRE